ncbi:MAG TPA: alpha/beta hydrolase [Dongiaceae bacterium]|nr:alpha/beta hydrolase [Dongiaceae bacterium]
MPFIDTGESKLYYEQIGPSSSAHGPDIVWVGGGGTMGRDWQRFQTPHFAPRFRNTTFDNRGIGRTVCTRPMPWGMADFARDLAALIERACTPPVALVGTSLGSAIVQQLAIDRPDLVRVAVLMGTGAWSTGWGWDYQEAEIEFRKAGGALGGMMGVAHYAAMLYPARALGDRELWPKLKALMLEWMDSGENETSLVPQWEASLRYDQRDALPGVRVPVHVLAFAEDVQAPPQDGEEVARLVPGARLHLMQGMGHGSWYGHAHDRLNPAIEAIIREYV